MSLSIPSSTAWQDVLKGSAYDIANDQQSSSDHDTVGDATNAALQSQVSGTGDSTILYFRARMGDDAPRTSVMLGIDLNADNRFDVFVEANVRDSTPTKWYISLHKCDPSKSGISPSTTGWLNSSGDTNIERPLAAANTYTGLTSAGTDLDNDVKTDSWITFGFSFADLRDFVRSALGIDTFSLDTPITLSMFTSGGQTANGDVAGINGISSSSWESLGILTTNTLTGFASGTPATPTIDAFSTSNTTPTLTGTWGGTNGGTDTLSVTVNGVIYTTSSTPSLVISGTNWTLTLPAMGTGSYDITATTARTGGTSATATLSDGLTVVAAGDTTPPTLLSLSPSDDATAVGVGSDYVMTFSENVAAGPGSITLYQGINIVEVFSLRTGQGSFGGSATISGSTVTINPGVLLATSTGYSIQIDADAVFDTSGNAFAGVTNSTGWNFTTAASLGSPATPTITALVTNTTAPTVSGTWGGINGGTDSLSVTVGTTTYTTANGLVISGTSWSLAVPTLSEGTYSVTVTASRTGGGSSSDSTSNELIIDTTAPTIASFTMTGAGITAGSGTLSTGDTVTITLTGSEILTVGGTPTLTLSNGATATYTGGDGTTALTFTYTVGAGDTDSTDLGIASLSAGITDRAGNALSTSNLGGVGNPSGTLAVSALCYLRGTRILTDRGAVAIEDLRQGDLVQTRFQGLVPVRWIGVQHLDGTLLGRSGAPVCFKAGSLGENMPHADLTVSAAHCMLVDGHLVAASLLVNDLTITQVAISGRVDYHHIELDRHDCVSAEGAWGETYWENAGNRRHFHNLSGFPAEAPGRGGEGQPTCLPCVTMGDDPRLPALRRSVTPRLPPSWLSPGADMHLMADDRRIDFVRQGQGRWQAMLPAHVRSLRLVSRTVRPSMMGASADHRALGVRVSRLVVRADDDMMVIPLEHPALRDGFHAVERDGASTWRWTDGDAVIPVRLLGRNDRAVMLSIDCQPQPVCFVVSPAAKAA